MRFLFTFLFISFLNTLFSQVDLAIWTFEASVPTSSGPHAAELGSGSASGATTLGTFSNPAGNGSMESFSANSWGNGKYFQFETSTTDYSDITINWEQTRSGTGPANFKVAYSTNGSSFTDLPSGSYSVNSVTWSTSTYSNGSYFSFTLPSALNNLPNIFIRLICLDNPPSGGTNRVDDFTISGSLITMPVEFSKFNVNISNNTSQLTFSTASETNNDFFSIERSVDGRNFVSVGDIKGAGNSHETLSYEFVDEKPLAGINYYRIKQTDFDGKYSYSEIKSVRHISRGSLTVTPRTTEGRLQVVTDIDDYTLEVFNASGQLVKSFTTLSADQSISIDELVAGLYFVRIHHGSEVETVKITKI